MKAGQDPPKSQSDASYRCAQEVGQEGSGCKVGPASGVIWVWPVFWPNSILFLYLYIRNFESSDCLESKAKNRVNIHKVRRVCVRHKYVDRSDCLRAIPTPTHFGLDLQFDSMAAVGYSLLRKCLGKQSRLAERKLTGQAKPHLPPPSQLVRTSEGTH